MPRWNEAASGDRSWRQAARVQTRRRCINRGAGPDYGCSRGGAGEAPRTASVEAATADSAGAVGALLQIAQSSGDKPHVQIAALEALCGVVLNHPANQVAAGDALSYLLQLAQSGSVASSAASIALKNLVDCCFSNQQACHNIIRSAHHRLPVALHSLVAQLQRTFEGSFPELSLVQKLDIWCSEARSAGECRGAGNDVFSFHSTACDDVFTSVPTRVTRQIGDTCFAFAAARSFNRR